MLSNAMLKSCHELNRAVWCLICRSAMTGEFFLVQFLIFKILIAKAKYLFREKWCAKINNLKNISSLIAKALLVFVMYPRNYRMCIKCTLSFRDFHCNVDASPYFYLHVSCELLFRLHFSHPDVRADFLRLYLQKTGDFKPRRQSSSLLIWTANKCKK